VAAASNASGALALKGLEDLLEGRGLVRKAGGAGLLTGLGARITRASELPSRSSGTARESLSTGVGELDRLLSGGLPRGGFVEIVARRSCGRFSLALSVLASATSCGETAALVDVGGHLDPQSAEDAGVDLTRLLWVRPEKLKHAVAAAEMLLTTGFALVVVDLGVPPVRGRFVPDAAWVRLERAARDRGAALLLLSPYRVGATPEAVVALDAATPIWRGERGAPPMLSGIGARMTLQKDASAREGARGALRLTVDPVLLLPSFHPERSEGSLSDGRSGSAALPAREGSLVAAAPRDDRGGTPSPALSSTCHPERSEGSLSDGRSESAALPAREGSLVAAAPRDDRGGHPERSEGLSDDGSESAAVPARKGSLVAAAPRDDRGGTPSRILSSTCHPERSEGSLSDPGSKSAGLSTREGSLVAAALRDDREGREAAFRERTWADSRPPVTPPSPAGHPPSNPLPGVFPCNPTPTSAVFPLGDGMTPFQPPSPIPGEGGSFFSAPFSTASAPVQLSLLP